MLSGFLGVLAEVEGIFQGFRDFGCLGCRGGRRFRELRVCNAGCFPRTRSHWQPSLKEGRMGCMLPRALKSPNSPAKHTCSYLLLAALLTKKTLVAPTSWHWTSGFRARGLRVSGLGS